MSRSSRHICGVLLATSSSSLFSESFWKYQSGAGEGFPHLREVLTNADKSPGIAVRRRVAGTLVGDDDRKPRIQERKFPQAVGENIVIEGGGSKMVASGTKWIRVPVISAERARNARRFSCSEA